MVILHDDAYYESRKPQPDLGTLGNFMRFIWDKERKAFLDRTAKEWGNAILLHVTNFLFEISLLFNILPAICFERKLLLLRTEIFAKAIDPTHFTEMCKLLNLRPGARGRQSMNNI